MGKVLTILFAAFVVFGSPLVAAPSHANSYNDEKRQTKDLVKRMEKEKERLKSCYAGTYGRIIGKPVIVSSGSELRCQVDHKTRDQAIKHHKIKRLSFKEYKSRYDELVDTYQDGKGRPAEQALEEQYRACNGESRFRATRNGYICDLYLELVETRMKVTDLWTNPWIGTSHCHIRILAVEKARADGCSAPLSDDASKHFKKLFKSSCDWHDVCYATPHAGPRNAVFRGSAVASHYNLKEKRKCDREFRDSMLSTCRSGSNTGSYSSLCHSTAVVWAGSVDLVGQDSFLNGQDWAMTHCTGD